MNEAKLRVSGIRVCLFKGVCELANLRADSILALEPVLNHNCAKRFCSTLNGHPSIKLLTAQRHVPFDLVLCALRCETIQGRAVQQTSPLPQNQEVALTSVTEPDSCALIISGDRRHLPSSASASLSKVGR